MQNNILLVALTALSVFTTGFPIDQRKVEEPCPEEHPQYYELKRNQSTAFAWQLVGSALGDEEVNVICKTINEGGYGKWVEQGLVMDDIRKAVCNVEGSQPNASHALPNVIFANTNVFSTQLMNAFNTSNSSRSGYLCSNLQYNQISGFSLNANQIITSTCSAGNHPQAPQPFTANAQVNTSAVNAYQHASSKLYAYEYASGATTSSQLKASCLQAPQHHTNWNKLQLDAQVVEDTLCSVTEPLTAEQVKAAILQWSSKQFVAVIENISNIGGYERWLCDNLDVDAMNGVGLDGKLVRYTVCQHAEGKKVDGGDCEDE